MTLMSRPNRPKSQRNARIRRLRAQGLRLREIAAEYGISAQRVHTLCGARRPWGAWAAEAALGGQEGASETEEDWS